jgi:TRAP-type C4-dicarboxylate transport system permease small subunit
MDAKSNRDVLDQVESIVNKINQKSSWLSYAAISAMMAFVFVDVILRYFGHPTSGSIDIVQMLSVVAVSFTIGYTHVKKRHPTITLNVAKCCPREAHVD